jgi:hypothetical protein
MRFNSLAGALLAAAVTVMSATIEADGRDARVTDPSEANLIAFVGRRLSVQEVKPKRNEMQFDSEYRVRAEVLEIVFGKYAPKEMELSNDIGN